MPVASWYITREGQNLGPYSLEQLVPKRAYDRHLRLAGRHGRLASSQYRGGNCKACSHLLPHRAATADVLGGGSGPWHPKPAKD